MMKMLLHDLFNKSVTRFPNNIAIKTRQKILTYTELAIYTDYFAKKLIHLGAKPNQLIAIVMEKGWEQIVAILSILKSGAAYLPIDPLESEERLDYLLKISEANLILTQKKFKLCFNRSIGKTVISISAASIKNERVYINPCQKSTDLAYVLFTSGSTGIPKGVMISHQNALNTILDVNERFSINSKDNFIALSQLTFDLSVYDIFGCFASGGTLVIPEVSHAQNPQHWENLLFQKKISVWNSVPALMDIFVDYMVSKCTYIPEHSLRLVLLSGDWIPLNLPEKIWRVFGKEITLVSLGGATEASIWSILYPIKAMKPEWKSIPYGQSMKNQSFYILDKQFDPVVKGEVGELFISGLGVAQGYWRDVERTSTQFIQHPILGRLYKTGDLGRYLADGNIEFLGRVDHQVKIAGYRIELNAIEKYLLDFPNIEQAIVLPCLEGRHQKLAAYLTLKPDKHILGTDSCLEFEQIKHWQKVYDDLFNKEINHTGDPTFNTVGWVSSIHNKRIPANHMCEWVENTVKRILNLQVNSIFEVGCGTGLLLFRLAYSVQTYDAIDFSESAISYVQNQLKNLVMENVHLYVGEAKDILKFGKAYDLVILNSVIQYFPSADYLIEVLNRSITMVKAKGYIFIGDIKSLTHLPAFYSTVLLEARPHLSNVLEWKLLLDSLIEKEDELVLDTEFFYAFQKANPRISYVEILIKEGQFENEMNYFRYDVILHIEHPVGFHKKTIVWQDWQGHSAKFEQVQVNLLRDEVDYLAIKNIPNKRTIGLQQIANYGTDSGDTIESFFSLKNYQHLLKKNALDPKLFFDLADKFNFFITARWSTENPIDCFDVLISKSDYKNYLVNYDNDITNKPLNSYANLPILPRIHRILIDRIKTFLKTRLPWYMIPSYFDILQRLPVNPNGKIDRKILAKLLLRPYQKDIELATKPIQKKLVIIWKKLLGIPTLGIHDDFMTIGGTSLLAVQLVGEIYTTFGVTIHIPDIILNAPTVAQLSLLIEEKIASKS